MRRNKALHLSIALAATCALAA
ncbi:MAG: hypothetical protein QOG22_1137, partial [Pseudonocardiales bacterium]|nr:hypothetical protein [Pseudonocardiales bacterium]